MSGSMLSDVQKHKIRTMFEQHRDYTVYEIACGVGMTWLKSDREAVRRFLEQLERDGVVKRCYPDKRLGDTKQRGGFVAWEAAIRAF